MHKLLTRQLRKFLRNDINDDRIESFVNAVDNAYKQFDKDRALLERSLELTSTELSDRNRTLREQLSQLELTHKKLQSSLATLSATFNSTGEAIFSIDYSDGRIQYNQLGKELLGLKTEDDQTSLLVFLQRLKRHLEKPKDLKRIIREENNNKEKETFLNLKFKNGSLFEIIGTPRTDKQVSLGKVWCFRDVTDFKKSQELIRHQAYHDSLTNLPNRTLLKDRLNHAIAHAKRENMLIATLFIDLDHFKKVNDSAGHHVGDELLVLVGGRLNDCIREHDTLARVGGDEFVILVENVQSTSIVTQLCDRVIKKLQLPFHLNKNDYFIGSSIGVSIFPRDGNTAEELLRKADMSMYHAKDSGRNNFQYFDDSLERLALHQLNLETQLRHAIQNNELEIYYQPKVQLATRKIHSAEALLRWLPDSDNISPAEFIPVAEQSGMIIEITQWVVHQVCERLKYINENRKVPIPIAINISPINLNDPFFGDFIEKTLNEYDIPGEWLEFELTESVLLQNTDDILSFIERIKSLNITLSIDDFGTGYSSLSYLHRFPVDQLKIDKSFILHLFKDKNNESITKTILTLAGTLGLKAVAEGVEDESTNSWLLEHGCDFAQGFLHSKPLPQTEFLRIVDVQQENDSN